MARAEKVKAAIERTPEERLSAIRSSLKAKLFVTLDDQRWIVELYDAAIAERDALQAEINQAQHALGV